MRGSPTCANYPHTRTRLFKSTHPHGNPYVPVVLSNQPPTHHHMGFSSQPYVENLTGTRGAYRPYNTTKPKVYGWEPKTADRA